MYLLRSLQHLSPYSDLDAPEPITSVQQTRDGNAVLVSTLDSTIRLMDKGNGQMLQCYRGHGNKDYRIRSCLGLADAVVVSGSEDGEIYAWDLLEGKVIDKLKAHDGKVASALAFSGARKEWASAGVDGAFGVVSSDHIYLLKWDRHRCCVGHALKRVVHEGKAPGIEYLQCVGLTWTSITKSPMKNASLVTRLQETVSGECRIEASLLQHLRGDKRLVSETECHSEATLRSSAMIAIKGHLSKRRWGSSSIVATRAQDSGCI